MKSMFFSVQPTQLADIYGDYVILLHGEFHISFCLKKFLRYALHLKANCKQVTLR